MQEDIIDAISLDLIQNDIKGIQNQLLVELKNFQAFFAQAKQIPNLLKEIGRLREITYREVGEGTGKSLDLDAYDPYCEHIFIWDCTEEKVVGAYRILCGKKNMEEKGIDGLYISTLFNLDAEIYPLLMQSLELGRSFIIKEYQKRPTPLFILWKALLFSVLKSDARYLIGPVSISGKYTDEAKSLTLLFLGKYFCLDDLSQFIHPKNQYELQLPDDFNEQDFMNSVGNDFNKLDKYIQQYEEGYHTPILVRQYISLLGTRVIGFNIDPNFNYCIDALMLMDLSKAPKQTIESLVKDFPNPTAIYEKLKNFEFRA